MQNALLSVHETKQKKVVLQNRTFFVNRLSKTKQTLLQNDIECQSGKLIALHSVLAKLRHCTAL